MSKPYCHNHPPYKNAIWSAEFEIMVANRNSRTCGHWKPLGNAFVQPFGDDVGGKTFDWKECGDCEWKEQI